MQCQGFFLIVLLSAMFIASVQTSGMESELPSGMESELPNGMESEPTSSMASELPSEFICGKRMDLLFLVDKSRSIKNWQFNKMKEFLVKVIERLNMSPNYNTQVALAIFANKVHTKWCFDEYLEKSELLQAVSDLSCPECERGQTVTGRAMEAARTEMLVPGCGVREQLGVKKVVVILTNKKSTETTSRGYPEDWIESQAQLLREQVFELFAIGVGNYDKEELLTITDSVNKVFTTNNFNKLTNKLPFFTRLICNNVFDELDYAESDVVVLLDKSGSINSHLWKLEKSLVRLFSSRTDIRPGKTHVALSLFHRGVKPKWCFNEYTSNEKLDTAINSLRCRKCRKGKTAIGAMLKYTRETILQPPCGVRNSTVAKYVMIITDGKTTEDSAFIRAEAAALQDMLRDYPHGHVVVVGVGDYRLESLQMIAGEDGEVVQINQQFEDILPLLGF